VTNLWVDSAKNIILTGLSGSLDYPTTNDALTKQFQGGNTDGFFTIISDGGSKLKYSTFIGGLKSDRLTQVFVEPSGEIILLGYSESLDFLPADIIRTNGTHKASGSFIIKLDAKGQSIISGHLLGDFQPGNVRRLDSGDFLIVGNSTNPEIQTTDGAFDRTYHGGNEPWAGDVYIMHLSKDLKTVIFATFFGGANDDFFPTIETIPGGDFFVFGTTRSKDLPVTVDAIERTMESKDAMFLARISGDGRQLKYCTYLGAKGIDETSRAGSLIYDGHSKIYITGNTSSSSLPVTPDAIQPKNAGGRDLFLLAFNIIDNSLAYGSYLGGSKDEGTIHHDLRLAFDERGALYGVGVTFSDDFPTIEKNVAPRKGMDIFISKFSIISPAHNNVYKK
jgi:hypothetical protein